MRVVIPAVAERTEITCDMCKRNQSQRSNSLVSSFTLKIGEPEDFFSMNDQAVDLCHKCSERIFKFIETYTEEYPEELL